MLDTKRRKWSREETILAMDLYCKLPFTKISYSHADVTNLAKIIGRTPSAVALKMFNLSHYDPALQSRNVDGMAHGSKLDKEIYDEFSINLEKLAFEPANIMRNNYEQPQYSFGLGEIALKPGIDKESSVKVRVGQEYFRRAVINVYDGMCCITGIAEPQLLVASHIKPWAKSDENYERTNPSNGLCLNSLHDRAFDRGLITVDTNYCIIVSKHLRDTHMDDSTRNWFYYFENQKIRLPHGFLPAREFLQYHNDVVFLG